MKNLIPFFRKKKNISQADFARMLGISPSYLCKIEKSSQIPSEKVVARCTLLLGVSREKLFPEREISRNAVPDRSSSFNPIWFERTRRGLKQRDLAKSLKCSPSYLSKVENGQIRPTDFFIKQCVHFFKKKESELFPSPDSND